MDENGLYDFFCNCGDIDNCRVSLFLWNKSQIVYQKGTKKSRGFGFVTFRDENGFKACIGMDGCVGTNRWCNRQDCEGRKLNIQKASERPASNESNNNRTYNDTNKVIINNLSWNTTTEGIQDLLTPYGPLEECRVLMDRKTGNSRGCAIARFTNEEDMQKAIQGVNETELDGRTITIRAFTPNAPQNKERRNGNTYSGNTYSGNTHKSFNDEEEKQEVKEEVKEEEKEG